MGSKSELRSVSENEDQSDEDRMMPIKNQTKKLEISDEDRAIGGVTFKVYWDYFRNGSYPCDFQIYLFVSLQSRCVGPLVSFQGYVLVSVVVRCTFWRFSL